MNRSTRTLALALTAPALLALAAGCAKDDGNANGSADSTAVAAAPAPIPPPPGTPPGVQPSTVTDPQIAAIVVTANATDSAGGVLALEKGTHARVKEFAQRMVTDHGGVNQQAVALVTRLGVTPEESNTSRQLAQGGQQTRQQLAGLSGNGFDRGYIDAEVEYHETVLHAIDTTLIPSAQNAELKALLQQVRPAIQAHLEMAKAIQKELQGAQ
ncbi:MAG TPA: DUF4142 domain-containing protein [Longimicrobium sp.]|nr:DUF4142 domain-containing protein [Longimicrobium sp.]